jgi:hypothetical protein
MGGFWLAKTIEPVSVAMEAKLILSIIAELWKGLGLELDEDPSFDRMMPVNVILPKAFFNFALPHFGISGLFCPNVHGPKASGQHLDQKSHNTVPLSIRDGDDSGTQPDLINICESDRI